MGPAVPETARATPIVGVHSTVWRKFEKSTGVAGTKARLMTDRTPLDNLYLLSMRVARRPRSHPLPLPLCLGLLLETLHGDGGVHQRPEGLIVRHVQLLLKYGRERPRKKQSFFLSSVSM